MAFRRRRSFGRGRRVARRSFGRRGFSRHRRRSSRGRSVRGIRIGYRM